MKTWQEVQSRLRAELEFQWFPRQCKEPESRFYLYYLPSMPQHDSGLIALKNTPPNKEYLPVSPQPLNGFKTVDQNIAALLPLLARLPILDQPKSAAS